VVLESMAGGVSGLQLRPSAPCEWCGSSGPGAIRRPLVLAADYQRAWALLDEWIGGPRSLTSIGIRQVRVRRSSPVILGGDNAGSGRVVSPSVCGRFWLVQCCRWQESGGGLDAIQRAV